VKKTIAIIVSVLFVFAISSLSFATDATKAAPAAEATKAAPAKAEEKKAPAKVKQVTGEVTAMDAKAKTITVKGKKGDVVIAVDDKMMAAVKAGDKVVVKYTEADGKNTAKSVKKAEAKPAEMEKKAEPAKAMEKKAEPAAKPAEKK
jgi:glucose/arabinose dehydrogenase